jgi:hypothetical protein
MPTLTRTAPSGAKANKKENSASKTRAASQSSTLSDHRPGTLAQMKVVEAMSEGPRAQKTAQLQALMPDNSPVQKAADEEEVQMKAAPVQKAAEEEEVQMKAAPVQKAADEEEVQMKAAPIQKAADEEEVQMKAAPVQKAADEEEVQMKAAPAQKAADEEEVQMKAAPIQKAADEEEVQMKAAPIQKKENNTGLPDNLKSGVENLSGVSMNDVKVHPNSDQPAQMQAHAFAQGTDIHVAPGQEQHLSHEAWHVVQQKQGRVKPTTQLKGQIPVNDDKGLEHEADVMGAKALSLGNSDQEATQLKEISASNKTVQRDEERRGAIKLEDNTELVKKDDSFPVVVDALRNGDAFRANVYELAKKMSSDTPEKDKQDEVRDAVALTGLGKVEDTLDRIAPLLKTDLDPALQGEVTAALTALNTLEKSDNLINKEMKEAYSKAATPSKLDKLKEIGGKLMPDAELEMGGEADSESNSFADVESTSISGSMVKKEDKVDESKDNNKNNPISKVQNKVHEWFEDNDIPGITINKNGAEASFGLSFLDKGKGDDKVDLGDFASISADIPLFPGVGAHLGASFGGSAGLEGKIKLKWGQDAPDPADLNQLNLDKLKLKEEKPEAKEGVKDEDLKKDQESWEQGIAKIEESITEKKKEIADYNNSQFKIGAEAEGTISAGITGSVEAGIFAGMPGLNAYGAVKGSLGAEASAKLTLGGELMLPTLDSRPKLNADYGFEMTTGINAAASITAGYNLGPIKKELASYKLGEWEIAQGKISANGGWGKPVKYNKSFKWLPDPPIEGELQTFKDDMTDLENTGGNPEEINRLQEKVNDAEAAKKENKDGMFASIGIGSKKSKDAAADKDIEAAKKLVEEKKESQEVMGKLKGTLSVEEGKNSKSVETYLDLKKQLEDNDAKYLGKADKETRDALVSELAAAKAEIKEVTKNLNLDKETLKRMSDDFGNKANWTGTDKISKAKNDYKKLEADSAKSLEKNLKQKKKLDVLLGEAEQAKSTQDVKRTDFEGNPANKRIVEFRKSHTERISVYDNMIEESNTTIADNKMAIKKIENTRTRSGILLRLSELNESDEKLEAQYTDNITDAKEVLAKNTKWKKQAENALYQNTYLESGNTYAKLQSASEKAKTNYEQALGKANEMNLNIAQAEKMKRDAEKLKKELDVFEKQYALMQIGAEE